MESILSGHCCSTERFVVLWIDRDFAWTIVLIFFTYYIHKCISSWTGSCDVFILGLVSIIFSSSWFFACLLLFIIHSLLSGEKTPWDIPLIRVAAKKGAYWCRGERKKWTKPYVIRNSHSPKIWRKENLAGPTRREWGSLNLYWLVYWGWNFPHSLRVGPARKWWSSHGKSMFESDFLLDDLNHHFLKIMWW